MSIQKYYKIFNKEEKHHGFQYHDGLNVDTIPFNSNPKDSCCEGGFYFTTIDNICKFLSYGCYIREVEVPKDVEIIKDPDGDKYRAHSLFLHERKNLNDINTWKFLIKHGADIHANDDYALCYASANGHFEVVKFLVKLGANIHACEDSALRWASENGHLEVVKYLVEHGADIHANDDLALRWASENGHIKVVKYLVEHGADIHAREDSALCLASSNGHIEVVKLLVEHGADIHAFNDYALRYASEKGLLKVVKYLENCQ